MTTLKSLAIGTDVTIQEERVLTNGAMDSGLYQATIAAAFVKKSERGATGIEVHLNLNNGRTHKETFYVTNAKGEPFYIDKQTSKKIALPSYQTINDLCLVTVESPISELETEERYVKLYDFDQKKDVATPVDMIIDLLNQPVAVLLSRVKRNKQVNSNGTYTPTADSYETNEVAKFVHHEFHLTASEALNGTSEPVYCTTWVGMNAGKVMDKRTIKEANGTAQPVATSSTNTSAQANPSAPVKAKSLFSR